MRLFRTALTVILAYWLQIAAGQTASLNAREKILFNAKIFTADIQHPYAEAIAIKGNTIVAVGNLAVVKTAVGANAILIDMHGQTLLPGFVDSHNHLVEGGEGLMRANVSDSVQTIAQLEKYAREKYYMKRDNEDLFIITPTKKAGN